MSSKKQLISIIIPVYNESEGIRFFLQELNSRIGSDEYIEVIVVDGESTDDTVIEIQKAGLSAIHSEKGRAKQLNAGAYQAKGEILYFLHADTHPPHGFSKMIRNAVKEGIEAGNFRLSFDTGYFLMRCYAWFTRFDLLPFRFGDQSIFVTKKLFEKVGPYKEDHVVMEDNEFIKRLRKHGKFKVLEQSVVTSARKYHENGFIRLQLIFTLIFILYYAGVSQDKLVQIYRRLIKMGKV